ncbi:MAG TPA: sugar ABC transporter ATP-binding protein [Spirochaetia bacterium]|nr:sugar ABC transporter ATP-binding protein [Spirochaetia bacterium]
MGTPVLEVRGISKRFGATHALRGVSLSFFPGTVHAVVGENGAGKTTLMNLVGGVHQPDDGDILLDGSRVQLSNPAEALRRGVGFVHQEITLCQHLSVTENVFMHAVNQSAAPFVPFSGLHARTRELLMDFDTHSTIDPRQAVASLSVSQQQVVEIVKALSVNCRVIIFDEPTAALTESETEALFRIITRLKEKGIAVIYISHRLAEIYRIADTVTVLRDGALIDTRPVAERDQIGLVHSMVGRELKDIYPAKAADTDRPALLEVRGLSLEGEFEDVSFTLRRGEILGFAGLVGSGRTEVARTVCGLYRKTAGEVLLEGRKLSLRSYKEAIRQGIVYLTEDRAKEGLFLDMSVAANISVISLDGVARLALIQRRREQALARKFVADMQIKVAGLSARLRSLSGGNQQKVLVAKLLTISPKVVLMDEPTRGIDVGAKTQIYHLLRRLASEGVAVLMISSELPEIVGVCDRVAVMYEGRLCGILEGDAINEKSIIQKACLSAS